MFTKFSQAVRAQYLRMAEGELFTTEPGGIFTHYLESFPPGSNPIRKVRTEHDCQCCKHFILRIGTLVAIKDNQSSTVWDVDVPSPFEEVAAVMAKRVRNSEITGVFRTKEKQYGKDHNYGPDETRYDHFWGEVKPAHFSLTPDREIGKKNGIFQVLYRGLTELREQDFETVLDLINSNQLYKGEENKPRVESFLQLIRDFKAAGSAKAFAWANLGHWNAGFRNDAIGTLFVDMAKGDDLDAAVRAFHKIVSPENYQRTTSVITQRMIGDAEQKLTDLGLHGAMQRRFATMRDISVNDVLFVSNDSRGKMKGGTLAEMLGASIKAPPAASFVKRATPISVECFINDILPGATSLSLFLENRHSGNFVSLTGGDGTERLFKWDNNFGWSYDGDTTDSVKARVKAAGGNINALLRVSLAWTNTDDLDLHCDAPGNAGRRRHIYYSDKMGILDVDMNAGFNLVRNPVENLAFNNLLDGVYKVWVNQYRRRETTDYGFTIEMEFGGVVQQYSYDKAMNGGENVGCFEFTIKGGVLGKTEVNPVLTGGAMSKEKWGVKTESVVPVAAVMYSPNHWGDQKVGARHLIFALEGCKNPEPVRGIYNEHLRADLIPHRRVFEVLGAKTKAQPTDDQISGVGFTQARGDSVTVVVNGGRSYTISF